MKKIHVFITIMLIALAPLAAQTITVVSPNGGETLTKGGSPFAIEWTVRSVTQNVKIVLLKENGDRFGLIAEGLAPGSTPYSWTVGETRSGEAPAGNYKVRVVSDDGAVKDVSDRDFAIAGGGGAPEPEPEPEPTVTVTSPRAGETWLEGTSYNITWEAGSLTGDAIIRLYYGASGGGSFRQLGRASMATESYRWEADNGLSAADERDQDGTYFYRIGIVHSYDGPVSFSGGFHIVRPEGHDFVISDPYLEDRSGSKGFRAKVTSRLDDFSGWLAISYWCGKMGLGNAIEERKRVDLRRGVPATVRFSNLRTSYFDNECDVNFVFHANSDHALAESNYDNNGIQERFCLHRRDGRIIELRIGANYIHADEAAQVAIRPADVGNQEVEGGKIQTRLEITIRNCGNEAITSGIVRVTNTWRFHDGHGGSEEVAVFRIRSMEPRAFRLLNCTVPIAYCRDSNELKVVFDCGESGSLNANNEFHCHPNFTGF